VTRFYILGPGHIFGADKASHFKFGLQIERKNCLSSTSILMKYVGSLILLSGYFVQLCVDVGITVCFPEDVFRYYAFCCIRPFLISLISCCVIIKFTAVV